jgi:hypothetical protein
MTKRGQRKEKKGQKILGEIETKAEKIESEERKEGKV